MTVIDDTVAPRLSNAFFAFVDEVAERAEDIDRDAIVPADLYLRGVEAGLSGVLVGEDGRPLLGGMRAVHDSTEMLSAHSPAVALHFGGTRLVAYLLGRYAPDHLVDRWVPPLVAGKALGSFAITEQHAGTDVRGITTVARRQADGSWELTGEKCWIGFAPRADVAVVLAKVDDDARDAATVALVVPTSAAGVQREEGEQLSGFRGMPNGILRFDRVHVPSSDVLEVEGFVGMMDGLNYARIEAASYACGLLRGAIEASVTRVVERRAFGAALADLPSVQAKLGRMIAAYHSARELTLRASESFAAGGGGDQDLISLAKMTASDLAREHTDVAMQLHAAVGIRLHSRTERMHRDAKVTQIFDGTSEIHETMLGRRLTRAFMRAGVIPEPFLPGR